MIQICPERWLAFQALSSEFERTGFDSLPLRRIASVASFGIRPSYMQCTMLADHSPCRRARRGASPLSSTCSESACLHRRCARVLRRRFPIASRPGQSPIKCLRASWYALILIWSCVIYSPLRQAGYFSIRIPASPRNWSPFAQQMSRHPSRCTRANRYAASACAEYATQAHI
jgi:hypothetical protein